MNQARLKELIAYNAETGVLVENLTEEAIP
jgi:hypothetical protein